MHLRLFSDFSHKHFVTYSQSVPMVIAAPLWQGDGAWAAQAIAVCL